MGDAFFRWDGFSYYGTFADFLPGAALAAVLWCMLAAWSALLASLTGKAVQWIGRPAGWKITEQQYLLFMVFFIVSGMASWYVKKHILHLGITIPITLTEFASALTIAVIAAWLLRFRAAQWVDLIQNRITPLVWLYGVLVILSIPLVTYHTWGKDTATVQTAAPSGHYEGSGNRPNIVLVTFDALSVRNMSAYGYNRKTTPFIDTWAEKASVFTNVKAAGTFTALTTASLMTGKRAWTHNTFQLHSFNTIKSDIESIPVLLKQAGYYTLAYTPSRYSHEIVKSIGTNGFDFAPPFHEFMSSNSLHGHIDALLARYFDGKIQLYNWVIQGDFILAELLILTNRYRNVSVTDRPPEKIFNSFLSHIRDNPHQPFFAWVHLKPPHYPYLPPAPYIGMFNPSPELRGSLDQYNALMVINQYRKGLASLEEVQPYVNLLRDRYDEHIRYCDKTFEDFIGQLDSLRVSGNTIVMLSTDHGEIFTADEMGHGGPPREAVSHIPLIVREPGQSTPAVIDDLVEQIDIPSTILELAGVAAPSWTEGRSLVPLLRGETLPERPAYSVNFQDNPSGEPISQGTVAVYEGDFKLIYDLDNKASRLFRIKSDPDERVNLIDKEHVVGQHLLGLITDKINKANEAFSRAQRSFE
jgi:arylsulfatase A-like enzyme